MEEDQNESTPSVYFGLVIEPGLTEQIETSETDSLVINNVCLGELPDNFSTKPVRLIANIMSIDKTDLLNPEVVKKDVLIASLIPGSFEHSNVNIQFSPLDNVTLRVDGGYPIHIAGYCVSTDQDFEEDEEGEEEE